MSAKKVKEDRYQLCKSCTKLEARGKSAKEKCQNTVFFCKDRHGPVNWKQENIVLVCCFVAQIVRNGDPSDPLIKAKIDAIPVRDDVSTSKQMFETKKELAKTYYEYMKFRSAKENLVHDLTPDWYYQRLDYDITTIFGIENDGKKILRDTQKPELLQEWLQTQ